MQNIIIDKPYSFVSPHPNDLWQRALQALAPVYMRWKYGIESIELRGVEYLQSSLAADCGIALTPNHCRPSDPIVMAVLSKKLHRSFHYMASWHLFMQGRIQAWILNRLGAFSVYREGPDREAIRAATEILIEGRRPLVVFPEGIVTRTNDVLRPFMDGIAIIAAAAARQRPQRSAAGPVMIHPVAIKYRLLSDVQASLHNVLDAIERRFCWEARRTSLMERTVKIGEALLALKELEHLGRVQTGEIAERSERLINYLLVGLELKWLNGRRQPTFMARVKALRAAILKDMLVRDLQAQERKNRWHDLGQIYLAVQLSSYPPNYLRSSPTPERLTETIERFEEDITDKARIHGRWKAIVQVGQGIPAQPRLTRDHDSLSRRLQQTIQQMINGINDEGKPALSTLLYGREREGIRVPQ